MSIGVLSTYYFDLGLALFLFLFSFLWWLIFTRPSQQRALRRRRAHAALQNLWLRINTVIQSDTFSVASELSFLDHWETFMSLHASLDSVSNDAMLLRFEQVAGRVIAEIDHELLFVHTPATIDEEIGKRKALLSQAEDAIAQQLAETDPLLEETRVQLTRNLEDERRRVARLIANLTAVKAILLDK
jgi:hypothetical protein